MVKISIVVGDDEKDFEIRKTKAWDVVEFYLDGKKICSGDWFGNIRPNIVKTLRWKDDR